MVIKMDEKKFTCNHSCKNSCEALHEALASENKILQMYKDVVDDCSLLDVKEFIGKMIDQKRKVIYELLQKLQEMRVKSVVIDEIADSYERIGG